MAWPSSRDATDHPVADEAPPAQPDARNARSDASRPLSTRLPWVGRDRSPDRPARSARRREAVFRLAGWITAIGVVVATFVGDRSPTTATIVATVTAIVLWGVTQFRGEDRLTLVALVAVGLLGAVLDALNPEGPGYVVIFLAVASIAGRYGPRISWPVGALLAAAGVAAEITTSRHPVSSALNILVGVVFVFMAASFAWATEQARRREAALAAWEAEMRIAQREAAVLAERNRMARELHDVLAHSLTGLSIRLSAAALLAEQTATEPALAEQIRLARESAREGIVNARLAVDTLRGSEVVGPAQLPALVDSTRGLTGLTITYLVSGEPVEVGPELGLTLYRAVQESLTNAARHAGREAAVEVLLTWQPDQVEVEVIDTGGVRPPVAPRSGGHGLNGLHERADRLGAQFEAGPTGRGWRVRLTAPVARQPRPVDG